MDMSGKCALVTGGSRGIGRSIAVKLAQAGADVGVTYHSNEAAARDTLSRIKGAGAEGWIERCDLADPGSIVALFQTVDHFFKNGLDIFVANAGVWPPEQVAITEMTDAQRRRTIEVNLNSVFHTTKEAGRRMRDGGRIILIGSTAGQRGEAYHADYAASKGALISLVKGLCVEFGSRDITVNCVAPGWVDTEMSASALTGATRNQIENTIPLGRVATADDIAGPVIFLCSELARHITGEVLNVNGGAVLCG
jgi:3-oxoacyl-[acyl-carrier protein] reductase